MKRLFYLLLIIFITVSFDVKAITIDELNDKVSSLKNSVTENNNLDKKYPVGKIYISTENTDPEKIMGGKWELYAKGEKLISADDNEYNEADEAGGKSSIELTTSMMPAHTHTFTPTASVSSSFSGTKVTSSSNGSHSHTIPYYATVNEYKGAVAYDSKYNYGRVNYGQRAGNLWAGRFKVTSNPGENTSAGGAEGPFTVSTSGSVTSSFTGNTVTSASTGSGTSFDIRNPYETVYIWKRIE